MKSEKLSLLKRPFFLTLILLLVLIFAWQVAAHAVTTVRFGDNTVDNFPGTVEEAVIYEALPDNNYGGRINFQAGEPGSTTGTTRSLIRFRDIASSIGSGKGIISATMYLYCFAESSTTDYSVSAYRVLLNWVEGTQDGAIEGGSSCWNYAQYTGLPWNSAGCSVESDVTGEDSTADRRTTAEASTTIISTGWFSWDLTTAVQNWYSGAWKEYGVILKSSGEGTPNSLKQFASSENINDGYRPYLEVTYFTEGAGITRYVDDDGLCGGSTPCYTTIEAAVADAVAGDTVTVTDSATYNPNPSPLRMKTGVDVVSTWIRGVDPPGDRPVITRDANSQTVVFGSGVSSCKLKGFEIQAVGSCSYKSTVYLEGNNSGISIEDCEIYGEPEGHGILLYGQVSATIRGCSVHDHSTVGISGYNMLFATWTGGTVVIEDTEVYRCGGWMQSGAGIRLIDVDSAKYLSQVTITNCRLHENTTAGIRLEGLSQATIDGGNVIYDNGKGGIYLDNIAQATVENNTFDNNGTAGTQGVYGQAYGGIHILGVDTVTIRNNEIRNHVNAAGICIDGNSDVTIGANLVASDPFPYGNEIYGNYAGIYFGSANSEPVIIRGNNIYSNNGRGGIGIKAALTGEVTITQNSIHDNNRGGISIQNNCTATITKNNLYSNTYGGGIHTGQVNTFYGTPGGANLTIRQNKIHDNQGANYGGGIDVRHASGIIENNLVYKNGRGGIRIGKDITGVINNTVVWNGFNNTLGGGIIYDDPTTGLMNDLPDKTYNDATLPFIRNNICAYNRKAGIGVVFDNTGERDYNLLYDNWYGETILGYNYGDCSWTGWPGCKKRQLGGAWPVAPNEIFGDPLFETGTDNYHLQSGSPAEGAGDDLTDMGCYGGDFPIDDAEIP